MFIHNQVGIEEIQDLLPNEAGRELLRTIAASTAAVQWRARARELIPSNGSMFFVNTGTVSRS
jgi:hypothetical protein